MDTPSTVQYVINEISVTLFFFSYSENLDHIHSKLLFLLYMYIYCQNHNDSLMKLSFLCTNIPFPMFPF